MTNPISTDHVTVLEAVARRLRQEIDEFNDSTCIITTSPPREVPQNIQHNVFCSVSPTDGSFDDSWMAGGGVEAVREDAGVIIVLMSSMKLDRIGHNSSLLADQSRGLLIVKQKILKALTSHRLADTSGNFLLTDEMMPSRSESPQSGSDSGKEVGDIALVFQTPFLWDLS